MQRSIMLLSTVSLASLLSISTASAQDALGSGNALDGNLSSRGRSNAGSVRQNYRDRNLLITDDVVAGRGFRGTVGYTAAEDFRSPNVSGVPGLESVFRPGSDDITPFLRDSAWSGVNLVNYGRTYQQMRFGQEMGLMSFRTATMGETIELTQGRTELRDRVYRPDEIINARIRLDRLTEEAALSASTARSTGVANTTVGMVAAEEGPAQLVTASSLLGLGTVPYRRGTEQLGLTPYDNARLMAEARLTGTLDMSIGRPFTVDYDDILRSFEPGRTEDESADTGEFTIAGDASPSRIDARAGAQADYRRILERIAERYVDEQADPDEPEAAPARSGLGEALDADREQLLREIQGVRDPATALDQPPLPGVVPGTGTGPGETGEDEEAEEEEDDGRISLDEMGRVLRHGERIERLATGDPSRFNELLSTAEGHLRKGEYFYAERHFSRALRFRPGHPLATAGLAHSQIGAGLYLSAALTVRSLFTFQPELIDARYDAALVPNRPRLHGAIGTLEPRLVEEGSDQALNGLLYAYVSRLLDDDEGVKRGLDAMEAADAEDKLLPLLRSVWLAEDAGEATGK